MNSILKNKKAIFIACAIIVIIAILSTLIAKHVDNKYANLDLEILKSMNYTQITEEDSKVENTDYVKFSAFFTRDLNKDGNAEKLLGTCKNVNSTDTLYIDLNVLTNGYLKDGIITINSTNFKYNMSMVQDDVLKNNYISDDVKTIELNQINAGTQKLIIGDVLAYIGNNINNYSNISSVTLTGTHVSDNGTETKINKTINLNVDWYGTLEASIYTYKDKVYYNPENVNDTEDKDHEENETNGDNENNNANKNNGVNEKDAKNNTISINFSIDEIKKELLLKENVAKLTIPDLNGHAPMKVICTNPNVETEYNNETKILTIHKNSTISENGTIEKELSYANTYTVNITYPKEAYEGLAEDTTITIPVEGYYVAYNNPSQEFTNPLQSNTATGEINIVFKGNKPEGYIYDFNVSLVDKIYNKRSNSFIISKQDLLNLYENNENNENNKDDENSQDNGSSQGNGNSQDNKNNELNDNNNTKIEYTVAWKALRGTAGVVSSVVMKETMPENIVEEDNEKTYGDRFNQTIIDNYTGNKAIYFEGYDKALSEEGTISIYNNDTNELIKTFTKEELKTYTKENPYTYEGQVKHIRIETTALNTESVLTAYNIKMLNTEKILQDFTKEEIQNIQVLYTYLTGTANIEGQEAGTVNDVDTAYYESEKSYAEIKVEKEKISTQETLNNQKIYIQTIVDQTADSKWKNGEFIVEIPEEIVATEINNITTDNKNVTISAHDLNKVDGKYLIKIITENETPETYTITIDCNMTPKTELTASTRDLKLYAYNEYCNDYYVTVEDTYDVNGNNIIEEQVGTAKTQIELEVPTKLVTYETITNYNHNGETTYAPNVAEVEEQENTEETSQESQNNKGTAQINIGIINNYSNTINGVQILGKIPFEGDTYVLNGKELNSKFTAQMTEQGIVLPEGLKENTTIYYSENETPNKNLEDTTNGWTLKEDVQDFTNIKTYLIVVNKDLEAGKEYTLSYTVEIPENVEYNQTSYSTHVVYYNLSTEEGNIKQETEPNKVGIRPVKRYNLDLTNYKINSNVVIPGATYTLKYNDIDNEGNLTEKTKILTTDENGKINVSDLYIGMAYKLQQTKVTRNYELNSNEIIFSVDEEEMISLNGVVRRQGFKDGTLKIELENEIKYQLDLLKQDERAIPINNIRFNVSGDDLNKTISTTNGKTSIEGLNLGKTYILAEQAPTGFYFDSTKNNTIEFKVERDEQTKELEITTWTVGDGVKQVGTQTIVDNNDETQPILSMVLENERIPVYNLKANKVDENGEKLDGAEFKLIKVDDGSSSTRTAYNGEVTFNNLYEYIEEKNLIGEYILQETKPPYGYAVDSTELRFKATRDENGKIQIEILDGENIVKTNNETGEKEITSDVETLTINIVNKIREFTITKIDKATKDRIPGVEFDIYSSADASYDNLTYMQKVTTDENGEIKLYLPYGYYKAVEVKAAEGYVLEEDEEARTEYFKIEKENQETISSDSSDTVYYNRQINYVEDLVDFSNEVNAGNTYLNAKLLRNIDFNSSYKNPDDKSYGDYNGDGTIEGIKAELASGSGFRPIGSSKYYGGTFDGAGYEIRNIYINSDERGGLFGKIIDGAIRNVGISGNIISKFNAGGIAGEISSSSISNCYNTGEVNCRYNAGGIVGYIIDSSINNCYNTGEVSSSNDNAGGIAGYANRSSISNCYNTGEVSSSNDNAGGIAGDVHSSSISNCYNTEKVNCCYRAGGIAGYAYSSSISNCYNTGEVSSSNDNAGGIAGDVHSSSISNCYNTEKVNCCYRAGGIIGYLNGNSTINNCYNTGKVNCRYSAGGIAGYAYSSSISNCYNTGEVSSSNNNAGGIAGEIFGSISNCYNTGEVSSSNNSAGGIAGCVNMCSISNCYHLNTISGVGSGTVTTTPIPKTSEEMKSQEFYELLKANTELNSTTAIWNYNENSYPTLRFIQTTDLTVTNVAISQTFTITKVDEETKDPLQNVKFAIYNTENNDYAKDSAGRYIGTKNENGIYVVTTDENGHINLLLPEGYYKAVEIETIDGYEIKEDPIYFSVFKESTIEETDIQINYIEDLVDLAQAVYSENFYQGKTVILMRTLDFNDDESYRNPNDTSYGDYNRDSKIEGIKAELRSGEGFFIGGATDPFMGTFNGNGYEIRNLYINSNYSYIGLFSSIRNATITNLGITGNSTITGGTVATGAIVGYMSNSTISNCYNTEDIKAGKNAYVGGIVGRNPYDDSTIINCYNKGTITGEGNNDIGGIIGYMSAQTPGTVSISDCYNEGKIKSDSETGGIAGYATDHAIINRCYNNATIEGYNAGGIAGGLDWSALVSNSYNLGNINASNGAGGISGVAYKGSVVKNSYNRGKITSKGDYCGGISGFLQQKIENCYNVGIVRGGKCNGMLAASIGVNSSNNYYLNILGEQGFYSTEDIEGKSESKTEEEMKSEDFVNKLNQNLDTITDHYGVTVDFEDWIYNENEYPSLNLPVYTTAKAITVTNKKLKEFTITKTDEETKAPIPNTKFAIYSTDSEFQTIDFAKDLNGKYIGTLNENNIYTFTTDQNGKITLKLPDGYYKAVEVESAGGYILEESEELRTTYFKVGNPDIDNINLLSADVVINSIEDLVRLSNDVNAGNSYKNKTIVLARTLDFNDDNSYDDPSDTSFGDYNGDGTQEGIKAELTNESGRGFTPIGSSSSRYFEGTFDGNGNEIRNIYINNSNNDYIGLFGYASYSTIKDLGISGNITGKDYVGGIVGYTSDSKINNCYNKGHIVANENAGGIIGCAVNNTIINNCYNIATVETTRLNIGGIVGNTDFGSSINNSYNLGDIIANENCTQVGGIAGTTAHAGEINNCYNFGKVICSSNSNPGSVGGIVGHCDSSGGKVTNCYNIGTVQGNNKGEIAGSALLTGSYGLTNCYYLDTLGSQGVYGNDDVLGRVEAKTAEFMKSQRFKELLNTNKESITPREEVELENWIYENNQYPKFIRKEYITDSQATIENRRIEDYTITKVDEETGAPIQGAQFAIYYSSDSTYTNLTPAKDIDGNYVGTRNSDGIYILTTDENGKIKLSLPSGYYKAVEVKAAEGYMLADDEASRTSYFVRTSQEPGGADIEINYIEDLVDLSNAIYSSSERYEGKTIKLMRTLDFNDDASYRNSNDTETYGDYNGDNKAEGIKAELTNKSGRGFRPIGINPGAYFAGTFDGNGYEIKNIYVNSTEYGVGLFGCIINGKVSDLGLAGNGHIKGNNSNGTGGIVGIVSNVVIANCYSAIDIDGAGQTGGIVGNYYGSDYKNKIIKCHNSGTVTTTSGASVGGIAGGVNNVTIIDCYNNGDINPYGYGNMGGVVGYATGSENKIVNCYNSGRITVNNNTAGPAGIVGNLNNGTLTNCYNTGEVTNGTYSSNTRGIAYGLSNSTISNCYYLNNSAPQGISGQADSAGISEAKSDSEMESIEFYKLLNNNKGKIESDIQLASWAYNKNSYPTLALTQTTNLTISNIKEGKDFTITKIDEETNNPIANVKFAIYNTETNDFAKNKLGRYIGTRNEDGIYVLTTNENGQIIVNLPNGYYKAVEIQSADGYVLEESEASRTTYFKVGEEGANADFTIYYVEDLIDLSNELLDSNVTYKGKRVELLRTIDFNDDASYRNPNDTSYGDYNGDNVVEGIKAELTKEDGAGFKPIGGTSGSYNQGFSGTFDGNGYEIRNVYINRSQYGNGLFSCLSYAKISNLGVSGNISYNASGLGGIAGCAEYSTISNCYNMAKISSGNVGGIVGYAHNCTIMNCYNAGDVIGSGSAGGIVVNANNSIIMNCYNTGDIIGDYSAGGITVGASNSTITNCYNTGNVTARTSSSGGIVGGTVTNSTITNCYSTGKISSESSQEGAIIGQSPSSSTITKCYYQTSSASKGIYGQTDAAGIAAAISESELKDNKFIKLLNNNKNNTTSDTFLLDWISDDSGYPTLELKPFIKGNEITITNKKINTEEFVITKLDEETNTPIPNTKFAVYKTDSAYQTIDFAKDVNGKYIGTLENEIYTIKTNENGKISLQLPDGYYKAVEVENAEGYILEESEALRTIYFKIGTDDSGADITINYIEDLVELSNGTLAGNTYEGKTIKLLRNLDFNDDASYRNPDDTRYGDYNGDEITEGIKAELTNKAGCGFKPIGSSRDLPFKGTFDGNGYEIKNIYINSSSIAGLFGCIDNSIISNVKINGNISSSNYVGGVVGYANESKVINCYNEATISGNCSYSGYNTTGGIVGLMRNTIVMNCSNLGQIQGGAGIVGSTEYSTKNEIINCVNIGTIQGGSRGVGGILGGDSADIINCYNFGEVSGSTARSGGIVGWIGSDYKIINCYNIGNVANSNNVLGGIVGYCDNSNSVSNCYYLNTSASQGIQGLDDIEGKAEAKTEAEINSKDFADQLNENRNTIESTIPLFNWQYNENSSPTLIPIELIKANEATITNRKIAKITVHHYKQGTGPEFGNDPIILAPDETTTGSEGEEYTTSPKDGIEHYTLAKDENGEDIIPENATGTYKSGNQDVYYYYTRDPLNVIVHHYLEGTETKVPLGTNEDGNKIVAEDENYTYEEGDHYKVTPLEEVLKKYELVEVVGNEKQEHITQDEEIIYYYKLKEHEITTRVEIPDGRLEKGGQITGEGEAPYETVKHEESSVKEIVITPDQGYRAKQIRIVSTDESGNKTETMLYGKDAVETAEIAYRPQLDGSITLTQFTNMTEDKEIIVQFEPNEGKVIVHHYIENTEEKIHEDQITKDVIGKLVETNSVEKEKYVVVEEPEEKNTTITEEVQEKTYYYQKEYKITTDVIEHNETYKDGTVKKNIKGGTITDEDKDSHENVLKNRNSKDIIEITPDKDYEIVKITINDKDYNFKETIDENGKVTLPEGFFENMQEDKHIEVEFRRKTKVIVKYLEEPEKQETEDGEEVEIDIEKAKVLAEKVIIKGYESQDFETAKKSIPYYKDSDLGITDENIKTTTPDGTMYADEITVIYWYTRVPSGIIVRHIETNEKAEEKEIESKLVDGLAGLQQPTTRNKYNKYIPVDRKEENREDTSKNITIMPKDQNTKTLTFAEDEVLEVWYFYEKQFEITTEVKPHKETIVNPETGKTETKQVDGGTISKEYEKDEQGNDKLDENGNKIEITYEEVLNRGNSKKEIIMEPEDGYRIKEITVNDTKISIESLEKTENGGVKIPEEYFEDVQENKHIVVEYEKIPAKVIVQYKDIYTKEIIVEDKIVDGYVNDEYNEPRLDIESYIPSDPEPTNSEGTMTEETITITYWYTKQFKITTDVKEHEEEDSEGNKVSVKGGEILGEDETPYEIVTRGEDSTKEITMKPEEGYRIKSLTINGTEIEIKDLLKEDGSITIPLFENMQEDKHIVVEFERIPAKVIVEHIDEETNEPIVDGETLDGYVNKDYETGPKDLKYYELVEEKYPENDKGTMTEEDITVKYYYRKLKFNMKIEKEIQSIKLNGQETGIDLQNNKYAKLEVEYSKIENTNIEVSYKIKVTNTEKVAGTAVVEEMIPEGFEFVREESDENWLSHKDFEKYENGIEDSAIDGAENNKETEGQNDVSDTVYMLKTKELQPGETAEYKVTLRWKADNNNKGEKINTAKITNTENEPNYGETTLEDNEDKAIVEIRVKKTVQDVIDNIKDGKTDEAIKDAVDDVKIIAKDIVTNVKTGDPVTISIIAILIAGMAMTVTITVKRKSVKIKSKEIKKGKHEK